MNMKNRVLKKKIILNYQLELITGLHIGSSKENIEIGGVDAPIVRRKDNQQPYIPGSSLKGKLRCLLELAYGINSDSSCRNTGNIVQKLFGATENPDNKELGNIPSRLIVRDAYLSKDSIKQFQKSEFTELPFAELKAENKIDRITGKAEAPRFFERIPAGAKFDVEFVINIFEGDNESELLDLLKHGIHLLERDYLGGSGSRGYGQVKFHPHEELKSSEIEIIMSNGFIDIKKNIISNDKLILQL